MIKDVFIAPLYQVRVGDLGPEHAVRASCLCGAGPWYLNTFWLRCRYPPHKFLRWIVKSFTCPKCGTKEVPTWGIVKAYWEHGQSVL